MKKNLYNIYLNEYEKVKTFAHRYFSAHHEKTEALKDQGSIQILESLSFFNASFRWHQINEINEGESLILKQFFSFLTAPLPAMGILRGTLTPKFKTKNNLPKNSQIVLSLQEKTKSSLSTKSTKPKKAQFFTQTNLSLIPVSLEQLKFTSTKKIEIDFASKIPRQGDIGVLNIYFNKENNYVESLYHLNVLKKSLSNTKITFTNKEKVKVTLPCETTFGLSDTQNSENQPTKIKSTSHSIYQARSFLHFPEQELYLNLQIPSKYNFQIPSDWEKFTISFYLNETLPSDVAFTKEMLHLFTVPVLNLKKETSKPILPTKATKKYKISPVTPDVFMHSLIGVYRKEKEKLFPIKYGSAIDNEMTYEIFYGSSNYLILHIPDSKQNEIPKQVLVEALWFQPWISDQFSPEYQLNLGDRKIEGIDWDLESLGNPESSSESQIRFQQKSFFEEHYELFLQILLTLRKPFIQIEEQKRLLKSFHYFQKSYFKDIFQYIEPEIQLLIRPSGPYGKKRVYKLKLKKIDPKELALIEIFFQQLTSLLNLKQTGYPFEFEIETEDAVRLYLNQFGKVYFQTQHRGSK